MSFADFLVYVDPDELCEKTLTAAMALAEKHDAHLTALCVVPPAYVPSYSGIEASISAAAIKELEDRSEERAVAAKHRFDEMVAPWERKVAWEQKHGEPERLTMEYARNFDLLIMPGMAPGNEQALNLSVFERTTMGSGRPVLNIPGAASDNELGKRVLVAWNNSRESARAVHDAMAFLESAEQVHLVTVNPEKDLDVPCADLAEHLARHGVNVEVESAFAYRQDVGKQILSLAQTFESDMMVMGLYGRISAPTTSAAPNSR